jgi:hypothetical protein
MLRYRTNRLKKGEVSASRNITFKVYSTGLSSSSKKPEEVELHGIRSRQFQDICQRNLDTPCAQGYFFCMCLRDIVDNSNI